MKKVILSISIIFTSLLGFSQDTIVKKNGDIILAKILEIGTDQIKYKKIGFEDGPTYIENKTEINWIKYKNGQKEEFKNVAYTQQIDNSANASDYYNPNAGSDYKIKIIRNKYRLKDVTYNERQIQNILLETNNKKIMTLVGQARDAQKSQYIGFAAIPLGLGAFYCLGRAAYANTHQSSCSNGPPQSKPLWNRISGTLNSPSQMCPLSQPPKVPQRSRTVRLRTESNPAMSIRAVPTTPNNMPGQVRPAGPPCHELTYHA